MHPTEIDEILESMVCICDSREQNTLKLRARLKQIGLPIERKALGYLGTTIIITGGSKSPLRYIIRHFAHKADMERWDNLDESLKLIEEANNYSTRPYETSIGLETWFTLLDLKTLSQLTPSRWKMANIWQCCNLYCNISCFTYLFLHSL